jgi:DNA-binding CsgD family transcriptional regulator
MKRDKGSREPSLNMPIFNKEDWADFQQQYETVFPNYIARLNQSFPDLTPSEMRLFMLLKIMSDMGEVSDVLGISVSSVYQSRYRLRKKLGLEEQDDLLDFIQGF